MLSSNQSRVIGEYEKNILSKIIAFQLMRHPLFLDSQLDKKDRISREVKENILNNCKDILTNKHVYEILKVNLTDNEAKDTALETISSKELLDRTIENLSQKTWCIYVNKTNLPFITSDNPAVMYNCITREIGYGGNGIGREETMICFPISSHVLIHLLPINRRECIDGRIQEIEDTEFIKCVNSFQVKNSFKQIFWSPEYLHGFNMMIKQVEG